MATDSTELTFVRCPSCRSLVPAVSSRCRMCGAGLDSTDEMSGEERAAPVEAQSTARAAAPAAAESASTAGEDDFDDPLGDYLQDFDSSDEEGEDEGSEELEEEEVAVAAYEEEEPIQEEEPAGPEEVAYSAGFAYEEPPVQPKSPPALKVESGKKNGGGLSFRKEREEAYSAEEPVAPSAKVARPSRAVSQKAPASPSMAPEAPQYGASHDVERPSARTSAPVREESPRSRGDARGSVEPQRERTSRASEPKSERASRREFSQGSAHGARTADHEGRLYGWLVSYSNPDGTALELREGKFFVTGSSLKSNDLVIDHPSVSTPHALVSISSERGLVVQDLMSDRGVFLRGYEDDAYRKEEETVRLEHGDWIRFGEEEFLVTLIPSPVRR